MKSLALVAVSMIAGIGIGLLATNREFSGERLPTEQYLAVNPVRSNAARDSALVVVGGTSYNFGEMDRHAEGAHEFVFRNEGKTPIGLKKGQTTCKCTMSEMQDGQLLPGESMPIKLTWTAKTGETDFSQSAEIITEGYPAMPIVRLHVFGKIIDALRADRGHLSLGSLSASEGGAGRFKVYAYRGDEPLQIVKHEFTVKDRASYFTAEFRPLPAKEIGDEIGAKSGVEVTVQVKPGLPLGNLGQTIKLTTNLSGTSPLDVGIEGRIVGDIMLVGPGAVSDQNLVALGAVKSAAGKTATLHLLVKGPHREKTTLKIAEVAPEGTLQAVLGEPLTDNPAVTRYPLTVTIPVGAKPISRLGLTPAEAGIVRIATTHPHIKEFVILVRFAVTE